MRKHLWAYFAIPPDLNAQPNLESPGTRYGNTRTEVGRGATTALAIGRRKLFPPSLRAAIFKGKANCAQCHVPPLFTEPGWNTHQPSEIGIDDFQANRSPDNSYRTSPLRGLFTHTKGGFYHDGRFPALLDVVNHYNGVKKLNLSPQEKNDLVEFLKSL